MEDNTASKKPYFIRAMFEWISDNGYTPHLLIDASYENMSIPRKYVENERITLNISSSAIRNLIIDSGVISFDARFDGKSMSVQFPSEAVINVFARETGEGMAFPSEKNATKKGLNKENIEKDKASHLKLVE
jgi:stringent starvation protein B